MGGDRVGIIRRPLLAPAGVSRKARRVAAVYGRVIGKRPAAKRGALVVLPMLYAPINGELVERDFSRLSLHPTGATLGEWAPAKELAMVFWETVASYSLVSSSFQTIAAKNLQILKAL